MYKLKHFLFLTILSTIVLSYKPGYTSEGFYFESDPKEANVYINGVFVGQTPCKVDTLGPGTYSVITELDGFKKDSSTQVLLQNSYVRIYVLLEKLKIEPKVKTYNKYCVLEINSHPDGAVVILRRKRVGVTPFKTDSALAGTYKIAVIKPDYRSFESSYTLDENNPTRLNVKLTSNNYTDSIKILRKDKIRRIRRISFGALSASLLTLGAFDYLRLQYHINNKKEAWDKYNQHNLNIDEYDKYYSEYYKHVNKANDLISKEMYIKYSVIGALFGIGFMFSIPF